MKNIILVLMAVLAMGTTQAMAGEANAKAAALNLTDRVNDLGSGSKLVMAYMSTQGNNAEKVLQGGIDAGFADKRINRQGIRLALSQYAGIQADPDKFINERAKRMATAIAFILMGLTDRSLPSCIRSGITDLGVEPGNTNEAKYGAIFLAGDLSASFLIRRISAIQTGKAVDAGGNTIRQFADFDDSSIWVTLNSVCEAATEDAVAALGRISINPAFPRLM